VERTPRRKIRAKRSGGSKVIDRFLKYVSAQPSGCWEWTGVRNRWGYGMFHVASRTRRRDVPNARLSISAHIVSWDLHKHVEVPKGLEIDHLCRNRACVNPDHLEPVTKRENILRGINFAAVNAKKVYCLRGHLLAGDNLYDSGGRIKRYCIACDKERKKARPKKIDGYRKYQCRRCGCRWPCRTGSPVRCANPKCRATARNLEAITI
jgi:hypothetical protein